MIGLTPYTLADSGLIESCRNRAATGDLGQDVEHHLIKYSHARTAVVIGASNKVATSVNEEACLKDGIEVIQRPSGGEAVVISSRTVLFSHVMLGRELPRSAEFFFANLGYFQDALVGLGVGNLRYNGISDLCIGDKKILGCAIYRRPGMILFQAVLNLSESPELIARYLAPPIRMPDYRKGRPHEEFVTSLAEEGYAIGFADVDICGVIQRAGLKPLYLYQ